MKKILEDHELKNKTLRERSDLSQLHKTAVHMFHEESTDDFKAWLNLLSPKEKTEVAEWLQLRLQIIAPAKKTKESLLDDLPGPDERHEKFINDHVGAIALNGIKYYREDQVAYLLFWWEKESKRKEYGVESKHPD